MSSVPSSSAPDFPSAATGARERVSSAASGFVRRVRHRPLTSLAAVLCGVFVLAGVVAGASGARLRAADRAARAFRFEEAQRLLDSVFPIRSWWDSDAHFLAARLARHRDEFDLAAEHLDACQRLEGAATARVQLEWLLIRATRGDVDQLEAGLWNTVRGGDPDSPFVLEVLAGMGMKSGQLSRALAALNRWVEIDPDNAQAWEWRGWVFERLNRIAEAQDCYKRSLALDPTRARTRYLLAELDLGLFKTDEAEPLVAGLLAEQPDRPSYLSAAGQLHFLAGRTAEARACFDRAYALDPTDPDVPIRRARLELQAENRTAAETWLRRALALDANNVEAHYLLHQTIGGQPGRGTEAADQLATYRKTKDRGERLSKLMRELVPTHPANPGYMAELGDLLFQAKQPDRAVYWHLRALQIDPEYAPSHRALAEHYDQTGRPVEAAEHRKHLAAPKAP